MVKRVLVYGLVAGLAGLSASFLAMTEAEAFRMASINGKTCRVEGKNPHYHLGVSRYLASEKAALDRAIAKWSRFATWEYGPAFGDFYLAEKRTIDCAPGAGGHNWACAVRGQPCSR